MDPARFSLIAHEGIALWNPLPEDATLRLVDTLDAGPSSRILDIGCGRAALLIRLLARTGARGVGVDRTAAAIAGARADAAGRVDPSRLDLRAETFDAARFAAGSFDATFCIGATHACGGLAATLAALQRLVRPGGTALVGEGHWLREPDPAYLTFLGGARDDLLDDAGNRAAADAAGFDVVRVIDCDRAAFDRYEDRYAANVESWAAVHPADPEAGAFLRRIRAWRAAYLRWGRETLGFALYVLRRR